VRGEVELAGLEQGAHVVAVVLGPLAQPGRVVGGRLRDVHGLDVLVPAEQDRRIVHDVIYEELCVGVIAKDSREQYRRIIRSLTERGAEGILLGCTELDLLVGPGDAPVPIFDTTTLHAQHAVDLALADA